MALASSFSPSYSLPNLSSEPKKFATSVGRIHPFLSPRSPIFRVGCSSQWQGKDSLNFSLSASVTSADPVLDNAVEEVQLPKGDTWSIHKFGGTCVETSERIQNVVNIVVNDVSERKLVIVSAVSKVMDMMYDFILKAQDRDDSYIIALDVLLEKHKSTAIDLLVGDDLANFLGRLHKDINNP